MLKVSLSFNIKKMASITHNGAPESFESEYSIISAELPGEENYIGPRTSPARVNNSTLDGSPEPSFEQMQSCITELVVENASLRNELGRQKQLIKQHAEEVTDWHNSLTTSMSQQKLHIMESEEKIAKLEKENASLRRALTDSQTKIRETASPSTDDDVDFEIVSQKELKNDTARKLAEKEVPELKDNSQQISITEDIIIQLKDQIKGLEDSLALKNSELEEEKASHSETKKMFNKVQINYDRVTRLLQVQSKDEREKVAPTQEFVDIEREMDTKMYLEQIDSLTAKLFEMEEKAAEDERKINALASEVESMKSDSESVPILKSQIEVMQSDLNSEKLARQANEEEFNRLFKQMQEQSSLCDNCSRSISSSKSANSGISNYTGRSTQSGRSNFSSKSISSAEGSLRASNKKAESSKRERPELSKIGDMFVCPLCTRRFACLKAVELHASNCTEESGR